MRNAIGTVAIIALGIAAIGAVGWAASEYAFRRHAYYAPRYEDVRRETFEHSRAFQEGAIRDLDNLRIEYARGDDAQKAAIADTARHRLADIPIDDLPTRLRPFARDMETVR